MNSSQAVIALGALAHEYRLSIYRMLVEAGPEGLNAGTLATRLKELIYSTDFDVMNGLVGYLTENCCGGRGGTASVCETSCAPVRVGRKSSKKSAKAA
jgi:ArsR family transcriptional regulator, arsenate/arsenite/antimonite-responsive transcriptional repressor